MTTARANNSRHLAKDVLIARLIEERDTYKEAFEALTAVRAEASSVDGTPSRESLVIQVTRMHNTLCMLRHLTYNDIEKWKTHNDSILKMTNWTTLR